MIYVMNQKFLEKNIVKMSKYNQYIIIDGENWAITGRSSDDTSIATKYRMCHSVSGFTPEDRLYNYLIKKKKNQEINEYKYNRELEEFLEDKPFIASCDAVMKALVANGLNDSMNVFIVLPNIVYRYLGLTIAKRIHELLDVDFFCVFIQEDLKENGFKMLKTLLNSDQLREVDKASKRIEKKYKLKYSLRDDD